MSLDNYLGQAGASGCLTWADPKAGAASAMLGTGTFDTWWRASTATGAAIRS